MKSNPCATILIAFCIASCSQSEPDASAADGDDIPSGTYAVDRSHTYLSFSYLHQGLSYPLLRATDVMGELQYDSGNIANSNVDVSIAANSIRTNVDNFDQELASRKFFNVEKFPLITFHTTRYEAHSDAEGTLHGNVTIRGITKPIELAVTFNNGIIHPLLDVAALGFSATGSLNRSEFGLDRFVPVVSDTVTLNIEIEFLHGGTQESAVAAAAARNAG